MNQRLLALSLICTALTISCSDSTHETNNPIARTPEAPGTAQRSVPQKHPGPPHFFYRCQSGQMIETFYPTGETATILYRGKSLGMHVAISGSGARYVGEGLEWWSKGSGPGATGTLFHHLPDGTTGDTIEDCAEQ
ncbi:MAG: MliC family protein [Proteobacteria bacterium]|nr:MliC family protein [Pseudomonadota bacterium]HQR03128.1 MliC family protein [Rhodocyclaceae bacterium]